MRRSSPRSVLGFAVRLGLAAVVAAAGWWILREPFGAAFRALGNLVVACLGGGEAVGLAPERGGGILHADTQIVFTRGGVALRSVEVPSLQLAYIPMAVVCGLGFAAGQWSRASWRRLLLGVGAVVALVGLSVAILAIYFGLTRPTIAFPGFGAFALEVDLAYRILVLPGFQYVVPAVVWYACVGSCRVTPARA